jgi:hypothetical protein
LPYVLDERVVPPKLCYWRAGYGLLESGEQKEVDELYRRWQQAGAKIVSEPQDKPWRLREFRVADLDDKQLCVFYDSSSELPQEPA